MINIQFEGTRISDYICPVCHGSLEVRDKSWLCTRCARLYPLRESIPDFLEAELTQENGIAIKRIQSMNRSMGWLSRVYESRLWYPVFINLIFGWNRASLEQFTDWMRAAMPSEASRLLDVACGPATYGRRLATPARMMYGVDVSMGMLKQGKRYLRKEKIFNVSLSRSLAEKLPFPNNNFHGAICAGSLHLFREPDRVLTEIHRCLMPGSPLAVMTIIRGETGILRSDFIHTHLLSGMRVFEISELGEMLSRVGFSGLDTRVFGSGIFFIANKQANRS